MNQGLLNMEQFNQQTTFNPAQNANMSFINHGQNSYMSHPIQPSVVKAVNPFDNLAMLESVTNPSNMVFSTQSGSRTDSWQNSGISQNQGFNQPMNNSNFQNQNAIMSTNIKHQSNANFGNIPILNKESKF
jgi:hypothetical protein